MGSIGDMVMTGDSRANIKRIYTSSMMMMMMMMVMMMMMMMISIWFVVRFFLQFFHSVGLPVDCHVFRGVENHQPDVT